jgi:hypothetical protein
MNPWTQVGVDEPGSRVEGGEPVLCDYEQTNKKREDKSVVKIQIRGNKITRNYVY